ncbi:MAG: hypothetical protein GY853_11540 [PVC group bacterium]|nr:hypothetical protein [PVC group bacterium]
MSIKKKSVFKILTNIVTLLVGLVTQGIIPRTLGPAAYGNFSFLTNFFFSICGFLNLNSSTVFFTKLSQRPKAKGLIRFYMHFLAFIALIIAIFLSGSIVFGLKSVFWPGQRTVFIILAAILGVFTFYDMVFKDMCDAYGITIKAELIKIALKVIGLGLILFLFWKKSLNLGTYFSYHIFILLSTIGFLIFLIHKSGHSLFSGFIAKKDEFEPYYKEFSKVCFPLFFFLSLALIGQIFDRWFLQKFSGSVDQGYYSFAFQVGNLCMLFTSAIMPLVLREQSIHFGNMDFEKLRNVFSRSISILVALTAFICCFLAVESQTVINIFAGKAYSAAFVPMVLMCLFPIHRTYGQLNGNFFFASDRVHIYRNIGIVFTLLGVVFTFFLLGPQKYGGFNLGANGLSFKMMGLQVISVNVQLWFNAKYLKYSFKTLFLNQIGTIIVFLGLSGISSGFARAIFPNLAPVIHFCLSGTVYVIICFVVFNCWPETMALKKTDVNQLNIFIKEKLGK